MAIRVFCIVEGHGDVDAFPIIVRRVCQIMFGEWAHVEVPFRLPKGKITKPEELSRVLTFAALRLQDRSEEGDKQLIIVSRDADDECPVEIARTIDGIAATTIAKHICSPVIPNEEFESWLLAGLAPLAGHADCKDEIEIILDPDSVKNPKGVFERHVLKADRSYSETVDQPKFAAQCEISDAVFDRSRSFRRLKDVLEQSILA